MKFNAVSAGDFGSPQTVVPWASKKNTFGMFFCMGFAMHSSEMIPSLTSLYYANIFFDAPSNRNPTKTRRVMLAVTEMSYYG